MCTGEIVAPVGKKREEIKFSLVEFIKKFCKIITCVADGLNQPKVNMCIKCGDLEIDGRWQKIPHPQRMTIKNEIESKRIIIKGSLMVCDFCLLIEKTIEENRKNFYKQSSDPLETSVSSVSF